MRKSLTVAGATLALLLALYAAAGYWLAPRLVRHALAERAASERIDLAVGRIRTDPFLLKVELERFHLAGETGAGAADRIRADLAWSSLWERAWIIERLTIRGAQLRVAGAPRGDPHVAIAQPIVVRNLVLENAVLQLPGVELRDVSLRATGLATWGREPAQYRISGEVVPAGTFVSEGTVSLAPLRAQGAISFSELRLGAVLPQEWAIDAKGHGRSEFTYDAGQLIAREMSLEATGVSHAGIELRHVSLQAASMPVPPRQPFEASIRLGIAPEGTISASGRIDPQSGSADLTLQAEGLALPLAQRWMPEGIAVRIAAGTLSAQGLLRASRDGETSYAGNATVSGLRLEESASGDLLLAWREAHSGNLEASASSLRVARLEVREPEGRLVIDRNGGVNAMAVFRRSAGRGGEPLEIAIAELRIENGTLHFADRSLATPFEARIRKLSGTIAGFRAPRGTPARIDLAGSVEPSGVVSIAGRIDLERPSAATDVSASFRNLRLASLNPYVTKFAGYRVKAGRLSADLRYKVRDRRIEGTNALAFEQIQLGDKVQSAGALDVPLELLVALLADPHGQIDLRIPVSGDLRDPKFDFGAIVAQAIAETLRRIVSAPFQALASLFEAEAPAAEFGEVDFEPGSVHLTPKALRSLRNLSRALAQRPRLEISVRGGYDPARDAAALREATARRMIAARAGVDPPPDLASRDVLIAAERLFLDRIGNRLELQALRGRPRHYAQALVDKLAEQVTVDEGAMQLLGQGRAEIVAAALVELGVEPARVRADGGVELAAAAGKVPTSLVLRGNGGALVGPGEAASR